jgi:hypothetical protein
LRALANVWSLSRGLDTTTANLESTRYTLKTLGICPAIRSVIMRAYLVLVSNGSKAWELCLFSTSKEGATLMAEEMYPNHHVAVGYWYMQEV